MRKLFKNKNKKGFAMAELLAVSIVLLFIFSILFSNYLPLVAEYETRLSYNDVTAQYAAHYVRKMYKEALDSTDIVEDKTWGESIKEAIKTGIGNLGYFPVYKVGKINIISDHVLDKENCKRIIEQYGIEEIIITNYKLKDDNDNTTKYVKNNYEQKEGSLYNYIGYLPNYEKSIYTGKPQNGEEEQLYRLILKTKDYGYATTPILSDYKTPGSCFKGVSNGDGTTLTITKYLYNENNGCGKEVIIKNNNVKLNNGVSGKITKIGKETFKDMPIEKVTLSDVYYIGDSAFENTSLLSMPSLNNIKFIGSRAFAKTKIKEVELSGERIIGDYAFADNLNLKEVRLPINDIYSSGTTLSVGLFARSGTSTDGIDVKIPSGMTNVGAEMFYLANIKSITLENGVQTIGTKAFSRWDESTEIECSIENLEIPSTVTKIGDNSFDHLKIKSLILNSGLTSIGNYAFRATVSYKLYESENNKIKGYDLIIPNTVKTIGQGAFDNSNDLKSGIQNLIFEENSVLKLIDQDAFKSNYIEKVEIPNSVITINTKAFSLNTDLEEVTLPENDDYTYISKELFYNCGNITKIKIPNNVTIINESAFYVANASGNKLEQIEIDEENSQLTKIMGLAFYGQANLSELKIPKNVNTIQNNAFGGCEKLTQINNYSSVDFTTRGCLIFYNTSTCDITKENNNVYINYLDKPQKTITNVGGATNE